jgi:hypothetical protein
MTTKRQTDDLEAKLTSRYNNLLKELRGKVRTEIPGMGPYDDPIVVHKYTELRLAIDDFAAILKEIKRLC